MKEVKRVFLIFVCCTLPGFIQAVEQNQAKEELAAGMENPGYHDKPAWFKESFLDIREDIAEAAENKKRVMLYFYQDGCPYCAKLLQDNFGQKRIADKTQKNFDVIAINMWGDKEVTDLNGVATTEKNFAMQYKVMYTPTLIFFDEKGRNVLRVNGYYNPSKFEAALDYVSGKHEIKEKFRSYLAKRSPAPATGKLHNQPFILKPPYNLQKLVTDKKPVLVLFEQKQCQACDELHKDVFKRKETITELSKFNVIRLDMWSKDKLVTPAGKNISAKDWAKKLNVQYGPTMVFLDEGKEVFRAEAYIKSFHIQSSMDYVSSGAYKKQPSFQRFIGARADKLEAAGVHINLMD